LLIALTTGLPLGELLAVKWTDLDLKAGRLIVKATLWQGQENSPKSGHRGEVPLSDATVATLGKNQSH
jgi:integrase